jgi:hypothetical protein
MALEFSSLTIHTHDTGEPICQLQMLLEDIPLMAALQVIS